MTTPPCRNNPDPWINPRYKADNAEAAYACLHFCPVREQCAQQMTDDQWTIHGGNAADVLRRNGKMLAPRVAVRVVQLGSKAVCVICKSFYTKEKANQVTCKSEACMRQRNLDTEKRRRNRPKRTVKCRECQLPIENPNRNQIMHTPCAEVAHKRAKAESEARRRKRQRKVMCRWCHKTFRTRIVDSALHCSPECANKTRQYKAYGRNQAS